ncbi:MAG: NAD(P)H-binding protein [Anaerolineae bacterium]|nr:NAD(P)H-binding protein [Anaerolineae bacterium]
MVGATGVLGRNVIPRLVERGHTVKAVVRRREEAHFAPCRRRANRRGRF